MSVKVSVISACYNHGMYITEMLESVLNQTYKDFEIIIVNDGSTDNTKEILNDLKHDKIKIYHTENYGPAHARNYAIQRAKGEYIVNLDADDKIAPTFLGKCVSVMDANPKVGIVYSDVVIFGAEKGLFELKEATIQNMLYENRIVANACFRRTDWKKTSGYSSDLKYGLEDYDFWLSIIELNREIIKINEQLMFYRRYSDGNKSRCASRKADNDKIKYSMIKIFERHETLYKKNPEIWSYFNTIRKNYNLTSEFNISNRMNSSFSKPTFTIITPTFRRPELLRRAIKSVLNQTFTNYEHIVVDDANDDETVEVISAFNSSKIKYNAHDKQLGAASAYNTGIKMSKGNYINFLDDDDEYFPEILEKIHSTFENSKDKIGFVWTGIIRVRDGEESEKILVKIKWPQRFNDIEKGLTVSTAIGNGFGLSVRKECVEKIGLFDTSLIIGEDTDFMIRLSKNFNFRTVPEILVKIHHGHSQLTEEKNIRIKWESYKKILKRHRKFLSRFWDVYYVHHKVYTKLCFRLNEKRAGFEALWWLIRLFPNKQIAWIVFFNYLVKGRNFDSSTLKK
ncbi:MAG: glycosyltransferase family 2 protein [Candidatus Cloacimonetes bacterium]|nr:glycosyltransferase family 2 protein [Candidatus Cloacimonadota bacterium]